MIDFSQHPAIRSGLTFHEHACESVGYLATSDTPFPHPRSASLLSEVKNWGQLKFFEENRYYSFFQSFNVKMFTAPHGPFMYRQPLSC